MSAAHPAFEAWYSREEYACYPSTKQHMQLVWQASRKAALEECVSEIRGMKANSKTAQSAINQCAEALENLR